jgi:hypothetical protein
MDVYIHTHIYIHIIFFNAIIFSLQKEGNDVTCDNMVNMEDIVFKKAMYRKANAS